MDFISILQTVKEYIPIPVIVAVAANIMLVYGSQWLVTQIENYLEDKNKKQYKLFDGKKMTGADNTCEVIAVFNALMSIGRPVPLPTLLSTFSSGGIALDGMFGTDFTRLQKYFMSGVMVGAVKE